MSKMMQLFAKQVAKEVVHEALKQHPSAIPWFIGINDDWTIGHLKYDLDNNRITFRSENFSERNFSDICCFISEQIEKDVHPESIIQYANFNNEPGRLVVKQLIEAVTNLIMDKPVKHDERSGYPSYNEPQRLRDKTPENLSNIKYLP